MKKLKLSVLNRIQIRDSRRHFSASRPFAEVAPSISIQMEPVQCPIIFTRSVPTFKGNYSIDKRRYRHWSVKNRSKIDFDKNSFRRKLLLFSLGKPNQSRLISKLFCAKYFVFFVRKEQKKIAVDESYEVSRTAKFL